MLQYIWYLVTQQTVTQRTVTQQVVDDFAKTTNGSKWFWVYTCWDAQAHYIQCFFSNE